jgi:hypothetical protein
MTAVQCSMNPIDPISPPRNATHAAWAKVHLVAAAIAALIAACSTSKPWINKPLQSGKLFTTTGADNSRTRSVPVI